jgi:hypothetical protein
VIAFALTIVTAAFVALAVAGPVRLRGGWVIGAELGWHGVGLVASRPGVVWTVMLVPSAPLFQVGRVVG